MMQKYHIIFYATPGLTLEATVTNFLTVCFIIIYENMLVL